MINFKEEDFKAYVTSDEELEKEDFYVTKEESEPYNFKINLSRRRKYEVKDLNK